MRRIDHDVVKRQQQQMYEHYGTSTEAEKKKHHMWNRMWQYGNDLNKNDNAANEMPSR